EIGEVIDGGERLRLLGVAEARMARRDHVGMLGELVDDGRVRVEPNAWMEKQKRPAAPFLNDLEAYAVDRHGGRAILQRHPPLRFSFHLFAILCEIGNANGNPWCHRWPIGACVLGEIPCLSRRARSITT